jgi:predicted AlkP superfamily phosphohydrolase/phosphomutase
MSRLLRRAAPAAILASLLAFAGSTSAQTAAVPRVVVIGVDGMSADRTERLMAAGKLPAFAAIAKRGGYSKLATTNPAQSPVSWATMTTGLNPGGHGIFDFLRRTPQAEKIDPTTNVEPDVGLARQDKETTISEPVRAALLCGAGAVGGAMGLGIILGLYAGERRKKRPHGLLVGTATGAAFVFSAVVYVVLAWIPLKVPVAVNLRSGDPYWVTLDKRGVRCVVLEAPLSFPADTMTCGCCLAGLGVPDCQPSWGTYELWTDDPTPPGRSEMGGYSLFVDPGTTTFDVVLAGPVSPRADRTAMADARREADVEKRKRDLAADWSPMRKRQSESREEMLNFAKIGRVTTRVAATIERGKAAHLVTAEGVKVELAPGAWSDLVPVVFAFSPVAKVHGRARFLFESVGDGAPFRLFVTPVQFDPAALPPNVRIASPPSFASDMARAVGPYETMGWPELTSPVKDDMLADRAFLDHLETVKKQREARLKDRLKRGDWDNLFVMFAELDRVQHALFRHEDVESPGHDPKAAAEFAGEIDRWYVEIDRIVGEVVAAVGPDTRVFVVSDHGFAPFRRGVNLNNFLMAHGLLVPLKESGPGTLFGLKTGIPDEWSETKAYAMGLGNLYLNLEGREMLGIVKPADADKVLAEIERDLRALVDPKTGKTVVRSVTRGKTLFHGARAAEAPDLVVGFEWGYRVSWQNCLGRLDEDVITDNKFRWSGDHCSVDPSLVPGVLFSTLPLDAKATPNVLDFAPSLLSLYGAKPPDAEGKSFLAR